MVAGAASGGLLNNGLVPNPDFTVFGSKMLFEGVNSSFGVPDLWITDGTSAGTINLTANGGSPVGVFLNGLDPDFAVLGNKAFFRGLDASVRQNLFVTDGTSAGTQEVRVSQASSFGLFSSSVDPDLTVFGTTKVLFAGTDLSNRTGLWVTDGTAAGTQELQGPIFVTPFINSPELTVLGGKALFEAESPSGRLGLWVTDGTAAGTSELPVVGAHAAGIFINGNPDFTFTTINPEFTVSGAKVLFSGRDSSGNINLWTTDGTGAGTIELTAVGAGGLFRQPGTQLDPDFTKFGTKVLFEGKDLNGNTNLWVTDGTSVGTSELMVTGANASGLFTGVATPGFTVLGSKVLFAGTGLSGHTNLWVTDGTSAGTVEVTAAKESPGGLRPFDITVVGTEALFQGVDASGNVNLWVTDGTSAGTSELMVTGAPLAG